MADETPNNNGHLSAIFTGSVVILLSFGLFAILLAKQRQSISTADDQRREIRLKNLADLNAENQKILTQYRWIDKNKGIVGIPIDQAMNLVLVELQANKPHPAGPILPPATPQPRQSQPTNQPVSQAPNETKTGTASGDPKAGKVVFIQCAACHSLEPDENKQGPSLAGIFGRKAGTVEDFNYSDANKNSGIVWDEAILRKYLPDPQSVVPGTKMAFPGLKDPKQVEDVIAYLKEATKK
jgi:cytochrome c